MRKIVITSGKGGAGKTTVTALLGRKLSLLGYGVIMVDGDVGLNNLDVVMGIEHKVVYDISDVIDGRCRLSQALIECSDSGVKVLPSSSRKLQLTPQAFRWIVDNMNADFVLIDCPACIDEGFHRAVSSANEAIVVTTPSASAIRDADKVRSLLSSYRLADTGLVVNRVRYDMIRRGEMLTPTEIGNLLHLGVVGVVPEDDHVTIYQQLGKMPSFALSEKSGDILAENVLNSTKNSVDTYMKRRWRWR
jgi:septum site-determining protein MinD